eukprot:m.289751 g.289751  ORF g.289751 m.289751 type:complete len:354 (+) comp19461_c1_seq17:152-1213(+)
MWFVSAVARVGRCLGLVELKHFLILAAGLLLGGFAGVVALLAVLIHPLAAVAAVVALALRMVLWFRAHGWRTLGVGPMPASVTAAGTPSRPLVLKPRSSAQPPVRTVRVVCVSDTHNQHDGVEVPHGDILLHAGDLTRHGTAEELKAVDAWLATLPHPHKIVVAGNHDMGLDPELPSLDVAGRRAVTLPPTSLSNCTYVNNGLVECCGLRIFCSPQSLLKLPSRTTARAFAKPPADMDAHWKHVPDGVDVLVTHGPPLGILDQALSGSLFGTGGQAGCRALRTAVARARPRMHVFGHIHEAYGYQFEAHQGSGLRDPGSATLFVNAASCNLLGRPKHPPIVVDIDVADTVQQH